MWAHNNNEIETLAMLYQQHGLLKLKENEINPGCFFLTTAHVYALEAGLPLAKEIHKTLKLYGRED